MEYSPKGILREAKRYVAGITAATVIGFAGYGLSGCGDEPGVSTQPVNEQPSDSDDGGNNDDGSGSNGGSGIFALEPGRYTLLSGLEMPAGLNADFSGLNFGALERGLSVGATLEDGQIAGSMITGPIFVATSMVTSNLSFYTRPSITKFLGMETDITDGNPFTEYKEYPWNDVSESNDFNTKYGAATSNSTIESPKMRARGLRLDSDSDGTDVYVSSNASSKIFKVNESSGEQSSWFSHLDLIGITDKIIARDGTKIIAVQQPIYTSGFSVYRQKRIISIDLENPSIDVVANLPTSVIAGHYTPLNPADYGVDKFLPIDENIRIVENSVAGKLLPEGYEYLVADNLEDVLYGIESNGDVNIIRQNQDDYPVGLDVKQNGDLLLVLSPLLTSAGGSIADVTRVKEIASSDYVTESDYYSFDGQSVGDVRGDFQHSVDIAGTPYLIPTAFRAEIDVIENGLGKEAFLDAMSTPGTLDLVVKPEEIIEEVSP